jgi:hypothetical protein
MEEELQKILDTTNIKELKATFAFNKNDIDELVILKYNLWARHYFHKYFTSEDAPFHYEIDLHNLKVYRGTISSFVDIAFRGAAKTARTKLFIAFCIANDMDHSRKYIKVLAEDGGNSKQIVTDVYNMLISPEVHRVWSEIFSKTKYKREETMSSFTTSTGVKMTAGTVGTDQRGNIQDEARPDFIWFEDFENRKSLRSAVTTKSIFDNMEEARTGLALGGSCLYTCNYISERGNVHKLVQKHDGVRNIVLIIPIIDKNGVIAWDRYSKEAIEQMRIDDEDFEGERLCEPSAGADVLFNRENLNRMPIKQPIRVIGEDLKIFGSYDPAHRYAIGSDVSMGVGLDSSTGVCIDFDVFPCRVVATYKSNQIKPDSLGHELISQGERYGECLVAPENNPGGGGHTTLSIMKQQGYPNIFTVQPKDTSVDEREKNTVYGWNTNIATKPKMFMALRKAVDDGFLLLEDEDLINEAKSYSRDDLMDKPEDPRLSTRHFDLLTACAIAWQMKDFATYSEIQTPEEREEFERQEREMTWEEKFNLI